MSEKPSYLGLLNAVAVAELGGEALFTAWAAATANPDVRAVLDTVALREAEHARAFAKRLDELGYSVRPKDDPALPGRIETAKSKKLSDLEKFERLGFGQPVEGPDIFTRFFDDKTIDIQTGELLGRYLSEERDTGRRLVACYAALAESHATVSSNGRKKSSGTSTGKTGNAHDKSKAKGKAAKGPKSRKH